MQVENKINRTLNQLLTDENFINLEKALNNNNIFRALSIDHYEIRHSKFLAYLLNPKETHGLGTEFLYNFVLWLSNATGQTIDIHLFELGMTEVITEWPRGKREINESITKSNRLDLLITIPPKKKETKSYCIAVECKIKASQSKDQLAGYSKRLKTKNIIPDLSILLSILGEFPENQSEDDRECKWIGVKYSDVVIRAIETTQQKIENIAQDKIKYIIADYKKILQDLSSENGDETSLYSSYCTPLKEFKIVLEGHKNYLANDHGKAYEYLSKFIELDNDSRGKALQKFKEIIANKKYTYMRSNRKYLHFYPSEKYPFSREVSLLDQNDSYPLIFAIVTEARNNNISSRCILTLQPLKSAYINDRKLITEKIRKLMTEENKSGETDIQWGWANRETITNTYTTVLSTGWKDSNNLKEIEENFSKFIETASELAKKFNLEETCLLPSHPKSD